MKTTGKEAAKRSLGRNHWNPPRIALCTCGWTCGGGRAFLTLDATNRAIAAHLADACEGCDHAVYIEDKEAA